MPLWIYQLPAWQFGSLLLTCWIVPAMLSYEVFHRVFKLKFSDADKSLAMTLLALVATLNSLLLAFCAVSVWDAYRSADSAISNEATAISELARDLSVIGTPQAMQARDRVRDYTRAILEVDWAQLQKNPGYRDSGVLIDRVFRAIKVVEPRTANEQALMNEIWTRANEVLRYRRERTLASQNAVPPTLWFVVIAGGTLSLMPMLVMPLSAFNRLSLAFLSLSTGLVFFFIVQMDRPFVGEQSVSPHPYEVSLAGMDRWDEGPR